jgi:hypothetical protein
LLAIQRRDLLRESRFHALGIGETKRILGRQTALRPIS